MTLFIQTDAGTSGGSGDLVFAANASMDLIQIANGDLGYGEDSVAGNLVQVTYDRNESGPCPERLEALVNESYDINDAGVDIIIIPVGSGFVLADGTSMAGNGTSREPGTAGNPTDSILVFYDVEDNFGDGVCLNAQDNGQYDLSNPTAVLLYHELSHAFRQARDEFLSLETSDGCGNASPEEQAAMEDENDMRLQLGERLRTTTNHCGSAGIDGSCSTSCCVVATVATGSPYSAEVRALRRVRDGLLRRSEIGFDFFVRLHDDYYGFSPEVCRLMAGSRALLEQVRDYFVGPLTACLELMVAYTIERASPEALGRRALVRLHESATLRRLTDDELALAEAVLEGDALSRLGSPPELRRLRGLRELSALLDERARGSVFVRWALLEPIRVVITTLRRIRGRTGAGRSARAMGEHLAQAFDAWAVALPLTEVWHGLSRYALAQELEFLGRALVRSPKARAELRARIVEHMGGRSDVEALLEHAWGDTQEEEP